MIELTTESGYPANWTEEQILEFEQIITQYDDNDFEVYFDSQLADPRERYYQARPHIYTY